KQHAGATYFKRTEKKETNYYHLDSSVLLYTAQEDLLREALAQGTGAKKDAESAVARRFREFAADKTVVSLWLNPRAFDAELEANLTDKKKTEAEVTFSKALTPYWKALDSVVVAVALDKELK